MNFIQLTDQYNSVILLNKFHISSVGICLDDPKLTLIYLNNGQFHHVRETLTQLKGILNGKE
jgi:hypothetical protein